MTVVLSPVGRGKTRNTTRRKIAAKKMRRSERTQVALLRSYKESAIEESEGENDVEGDDGPPRNQPAVSAKKKAHAEPKTTTPSKASKRKLPVSKGSVNSLLDVVRSNPDSIPMASLQWWEDESKDCKRAVRRAVIMLLQACGCNDDLQDEVFADERDIDEDVRKIETGQFSKSLLSVKDRNAKKLRPNMSEFWRKLIMNASDDNILKFGDHSLLRWLFALSTSQLKEVRFGACFVVMEIIISLLGRANEILDTINKLDRLVQSGGTSKARNKEQLQLRMQMKVASEGLMDQLFNSVLIHRLRDVDGEIRARCIDCLGKCISTYKTKFFDNSYLKYLGWALFDKEHVVRASGIHALVVLYESQKVTELEMFTNRFRERIVGMRLDVNNDVASNAMRLLTTMSRTNLLSREDNEAVYKMLIEEAPSVRDAAACFINVAYLEGVLGPLITVENSKEGKQVNKDEMVLKGLVEMITTVIGSEIVDSTAFSMVESLLPYVEILQDWSLIHKVLCEEDDAAEDSLAAEDKAMLAKFLVASLRASQHADDARPKTAKGKKGETKAASKEGSIYLGSKLGSMLRKFSADTPTLKSLVQIPEYIDLTAFTDRQGKGIKDAVEELIDIANKGHDTDLLVSCAESLARLKTEEYALNPSISAIIDVFVDSVRADLSKLLEFSQKNLKLNAMQLTRLKKILIICGSLDIVLDHEEIAHQLCSVLEIMSSNSESSLVSAAGQNLVSLAVLFALWGSKTVFDSKDGDSVISNVKAIIKGRDSIVSQLIEIATSDLDFAIRLQAALGLADIVKVYGRKLEKGRWSARIAQHIDLHQILEIIKAIEGVVTVVNTGQVEPPESLKETIADSAFSIDEDDPTGLKKTAALALVGPVVYSSLTGDAGTSVLTDSLATLLLFTPYSADFLSEVIEILNGVMVDWRLKLLTFQKMYDRILQKAQAKEDVSIFTSALIDAVGSFPMEDEEVEGFLWEAFRWSLKNMPRNLGFLDVVSLHIKALATSQTKALYDKIAELCSQKKLNLSSQDDSLMQNIVSFVKKLQAHFHESKADTPASKTKRSKVREAAEPMSPTSDFTATPIRLNKNSRDPKPEKQEAESGSDDEMRTPPQPKPQSKSSTRKSSSKGKQKRKLEDEEDEEGFVSTKRAR